MCLNRQGPIDIFVQFYFPLSILSSMPKYFFGSTSKITMLLKKGA